MVPRRYDVVIDGFGYIFWNELMASMPFRNQRAAYSYTPTFIERTNISGNYGDNQQDFFMTASQDDWSGGQGQQFLRTNDVTSASKFYAGSQIEISTAGQVTIAPATQNINDGNRAIGLSSCGLPESIDSTKHGYVVGTDLWTMDALGTATDIGAHGAGAVTNSPWSTCSDGLYLYISGASKIRKWDGTSFTDFSATPCGPIAFLNNTLFGFTAGKLVQYSTTGVQSDVFPWKYADGTADGNTANVKLIPFGPDLLILFPYRSGRPEVWMYDGTNTSKIAELPPSTIAYDIIEIQGVVFVSAFVLDSPSGFAAGVTPIIYAYTNGSVDEVWRAAGPINTNLLLNAMRPALGTVGGRLVFVDGYSRGINQLDLKTGAVSKVGVIVHSENSATDFRCRMSSALSSILLTWGKISNVSTVGPDLFPQLATFAATGTLQTSLIDFDNALTKTMRSVKIDWSGGGSVDIAYQLDGLLGSYTSLQTSAASGTEYLLPAGTQGHSISVQITLNNSAGNVPTLKRIYVRAAPVQQSYRKCQYILDLTGRRDRSVNQPVIRRDGTKSNLTGAQMAANLVPSITSTTPISVTDRFGTYNAVFEQGEGITELDEVRPGEFIAQVTLREV